MRARSAPSASSWRRSAASISRSRAATAGRTSPAHVAGTERVFIHEPPFVWHPAEPDAWDPPGYSNLCAAEHDLEDATLNGLPVTRCRRCPYFAAVDESLLFSGELFVPYDPAAVDVKTESARA
jgi:hypothetical protein